MGTICYVFINWIATVATVTLCIFADLNAFNFTVWLHSCASKEMMFCSVLVFTVPDHKC